MKTKNQSVARVLDGHRLRPTRCRSAVLQAFFEQDYAISHAYLERSLKNQFDRVTIYRTLNIFLENGIIHKVLDDEGVMKYAICSEHCEDHRHDDQHVHFKCEVCDQTVCLDEISIPGIHLPKGYRFSYARLLIHGVCKYCNAKESS